MRVVSYQGWAADGVPRGPRRLFRHGAQDGHRVGPFLALLAGRGDAAEPEQAADPY